MDWYTEDCITLKKEFPELIAGECPARYGVRIPKLISWTRI